MCTIPKKARGHEFETPDHLRSFIKVQDIKTELNDVIIFNSINEILKLMGSHNHLLDFIVKHASKDQLDGIYSILQKEIQNFEIKQSNKVLKSPITSTQSKSISVQSHFNTISCESIENICGFLSRRDIKMFKQTSRRISIICLNEMTKYLLKICIAKKLLHSKQRKVISWRDDNDNTSHHKYKIPPSFGSIFEEIQTKYLIPKELQIPIAIKKDYYKISSSDTIPSKSTLIVFDKRDITLLNSKMCQQMPHNYNIFGPNHNVLLTLHYFDIHKQEMTMIKQLIIDNSVTIKALKRYITRALIPQDNQGKYDTLKELMKEGSPFKMFRLDSDHWSIEYPHLNSIILKSWMTEQIISVMFQIDPKNIQSLKTLQLESESTSLQRFFLNGSDFLQYRKDTAKIVLSCHNLTELKQNITDYMVANNTFSQKIQNDTFEMIDKALTSKETMECDSGLHFNAIKRYLRRFVMNNVIPMDYVTIYNLNGIESNILHCYSINKLGVTVKPSKYDIQIYSASQAPFPFHYDEFISKEPMITRKIHIKNQDTVSNVLHKVFNESSNPSFDEYINAATPTCYAVVTNRYSMIYQSNENQLISKLPRNKAIKLFFLPFQNKDHSRTIKLEIRFVFNSNKSFTTKVNVRQLRNTFDGLPLIVFINKKDSLQHILMNNHSLRKYRMCIFHVYKVGFDENNVTSIPQSKRRQYNLWDNVVSKNSSNFIVMKLINRSGSTMYRNQYLLQPTEFVNHSKS